MTTIQSNAVSSDLLSTMNPTKSGGNSTVADAQDRFMTLLVTQMRNQDPLNPLDNAQVTSQLAQLSTVTGIDKLNSSLEALMGNYQSNQRLQAAGMIGHGVLVPGSNLNLAEGIGAFGVELAEPADKLEVKIMNASGSVVRSINLGSQEAGIQGFQWDGKTDSGADAAEGAYSFQVVATRGEQQVQATSLAFGVVGSVTTGAQGVKLNVPAIGSVTLNDVRQII
ncbi:flagellar hook assembly protein FlgD [Noviherbaspirillum massiliense]|uniref:flagellar hook assembly protein FlgD n=1 Tax=Noviherbaspirillum massiliense TaxID=1465823 RepID=UPI0003156911|nr:flagellar hook assembly protein FlgD [Noviherbaspirillum massiliense]